MSLLRKCILPVALGLVLAPVSLAGDDEKSSSDKGQEKTIRGVVSGVTVLGETDIDLASRKATTAEATYLTVIGHPSNAAEKSGAGEQASAGKDADKDVKRTSATSSDERAKSGERPRHRMNVYVLAVSPKTKVCETKESGKEGSASAKEEACELDKLEIGDRVEISFTPKMPQGSSDAKGDTQEKGDTKAASQKHGRHRTYFGIASSVKIMAEPSEGERSSQERK